MSGAEPLWSNVRPLNTSPRAEWSTATMVLVKSTVGDQPLMVPSSPSNRNRLCPVLPASVTGKLSPARLVNTVPVGALIAPPGPATVILSGILPKVVGLYSVVVPVPLLATHRKVPVPIDSPQELTSKGSVVGAPTVAW